MNSKVRSFNCTGESYSRAGKNKKPTPISPVLLLVISVVPESYLQKIKESPQNHKQAKPKEHHLFWGVTVICPPTGNSRLPESGKGIYCKDSSAALQ